MHMAFRGEIYIARYLFKTKSGNAKTTQKQINHVTKCIKMFCIYNIYMTEMITNRRK